MDFRFIKGQIAKSVGDKYLSDDLRDLTVYSRDYSSLSPQVANVCTEEVAAIMRIANRNGINVTVRGNATIAFFCTAMRKVFYPPDLVNIFPCCFH